MSPWIASGEKLMAKGELARLNSSHDLIQAGEMEGYGFAAGRGKMPAFRMMWATRRTDCLTQRDDAFNVWSESDEAKEMKIQRLLFLFSLTLLLAVSAAAQERQLATQSVGLNLEDMKFGPIPSFPSCATGSVQNGDPSKEPSILIGKLQSGCSIPWHWHTPNEHLMMVTGLAHVEMKDGRALTLRPGGFALMPSKHVHQFRCERACTLYVYSDVAFDIHYVDTQGNEIKPSEALQRVKETVAND
jgi:quercetin dioxygenase-like cupin family protein